MGLFDYPDTVVPEKSLQEITFLADLSEVDWARIKSLSRLVISGQVTI
jgi:hypothetical protein